MKMTSGGCYSIDAARVRRVENSARAVGLTRWRERQDDLARAASAIIHEHRHLTAEEIGLFEAMRSELKDVEAAIASLEREAGAPAASREAASWEVQAGA